MRTKHIFGKPTPSGNIARFSERYTTLNVYTSQKRYEFTTHDCCLEPRAMIYYGIYDCGTRINTKTIRALPHRDVLTIDYSNVTTEIVMD